MAFRLHVPRNLLRGMIAQAVAEHPNECCGLLAGVREEGNTGDEAVARVLRRYPLVNALASPREFLSEARGMFDADKEMRLRGLDLLAVYHSHPTSHAVPSRTDLERHGMEEVTCFIVSLTTDPPTVRAWWLTDDNYREAVWDAVEDMPG
jgi:proteasome lid subunit RPN8/RPN11